MNFVIFTVKSMTYAIKGQKLLSASNIRSEIVHLSPAQTKRGCAYGISVETQRLNEATEILRRANLSYSELIKGR